MNLAERDLGRPRRLAASSPRTEDVFGAWRSLARRGSGGGRGPRRCRRLPAVRAIDGHGTRRQPRLAPGTTKGRLLSGDGLVAKLNRRRPTLPGPCGPSTIGAEGLNCSVRNGKRFFPLAIATGTHERTLGPADLQNRTAPTSKSMGIKNIRQALDPLVPVSFTHCCASRSGLSTWWSTRGLTPSKGWESSSRGRLPA